MRSNKIAAVVVLSILAMIASVTVCMVTPDRSSADDSSGAVTYKFHLELENPDGKKHNSSWLTATADSVSKEGFIAALRSAMTTCGNEVDVTDEAWLNSFVIDGVTYRGSDVGMWGKEGFYGFSVYYPSGDRWGMISKYDESSIIVIVLNEIKHSDPGSSNYRKDEYGSYWTLLPKSASCTVTFDANGGNLFGDKTAEVIPGFASTFAQSASRDGRSFDGWYTAATGGDKIVSGDVCAVFSDTTLYAHWTSISNSNNTWLYIAIAAIAITAVVGAAYYYIFTYAKNKA